MLSVCIILLICSGLIKVVQHVNGQILCSVWELARTIVALRHQEKIDSCLESFVVLLSILELPHLFSIFLNGLMHHRRKNVRGDDDWNTLPSELWVLLLLLQDNSLAFECQLCIAVVVVGLEPLLKGAFVHKHKARLCLAVLVLHLKVRP